jgi:hypothetical protein
MNDISQIPALQIIVGAIGGFGGSALGYWIFSPRKPGLSWLASQLRTLGALLVMGVGFSIGQLAGYLLYKLTTK